MNKLTQLAKSEKGKELIDKAQAIANDPKNREKLDAARGKIEEGIESAKHKIAEKRGETGDAPAGAPADDAPTGAAAASDPLTTPVPPAPQTAPPAEADYGSDEGPKAA
jgi:hypothetical protein